MVNTLTGLAATTGRTVYFERYPLGYMLGQGSRPGTYSTWATSAQSDRLNTYLAITGNTPKRVVLTRFALDLDDGGFPSPVNLAGFDADYEEIYRDDQVRVYERREEGSPAGRSNGHSAERNCGCWARSYRMAKRVDLVGAMRPAPTSRLGLPACETSRTRPRRQAPPTTPR